MPKRKFEYVDDSSSKFWHIEYKSKQQTVWFGKTGTAGQAKTKSFDSAALAKESALKLIAQKLKKGYSEVGARNQSKKVAAAKKSRLSPDDRRSKVDVLDRHRFENFFARLRKNELGGHPKLTNKLLRKVEKKLGIKFPESLVELLKIQNGGYIPESYFKLGRRVYEELLIEIWPISEKGIEPIVPRFEDHLEMVEKGRLTQPELIFPFCGDGHYFFALDYRKKGPKNEPAIVYLEVELSVSCKKVADSFDQLLRGWRPPEIETVRVIDINSVDPKSIIGSRTEKWNTRDNKPERVTCSDWLCIQSNRVIHYQFYGSQRKLKNGKWSEEFGFEKWTRRSFNLSDVFSLEVRRPYKSKCFVCFNNQEMRATKGKKPVFRKTTSTLESMERSVSGKPWKVKNKKDFFYFYEVMIDGKQIDSCFKKLKTAVKKVKS